MFFMTGRKALKIILSLFLIATIMAPNALPFSAKYAAAQSANGELSGSAGTGFNAGGIIASAISCSGLMDKLASALSSLFSVTEVPVGDAGLRTKENCMDAIVHQLVVMILDKITLATVDWINSGFEGQPLYLSDPEDFFTNIAQDEINRVTGWYGCTTGNVNCGEDYPFGQIVMSNIISTIQSQLAANVRFSLNQVLAHGTYEEYKFDFNVGGWAGYTAMLQPNNNIFGNNLLINKELGRRIGGTSMTISQNFKAQVTESGGFLNQRRCVLTATNDPGDYYIPKDDEMHVPPGGPIPQAVYNAANMNGPYDVPTETQQATLTEYTLRSECKEWRTTTPGNIVSSKITSALNISDNKLIQADEISESLGLIFDALINQLVNTGLESLSSFASSDGGGGGLNSVLVAQVNGEQPGQVTNGQAPPPAIDAITGTGYSQEPLLLVQQQYIQLAQQAVPQLDTLMKKIRALDYCVPGPHPSWLDEAEENFQNVLLSVQPFVSSNPDSGDAEEENQSYYAAAINTITGINISESPAMHNHTQFTAFMNNVFNKYAARMQDTANMGYSRFLAPPATRVFLQNLMDEMETYQTTYDNLNEYLTNITSYMPQLIQIDAALNDLADGNGGVLDEDDPQVQAQISLFNSISDHFATEAQLDYLEVNYVLYQNRETTVNSHINSCLAETVNVPYQPDQRVMYPTPILPTYQQNDGAEIPTNMPNFDDAFLPGVDFTDNTNGGDIDVSFENVQIIGSEPLTIFETVLQSVY